MDSAYLPTILSDIHDCFNQADASLNWQFTRKGSLNFGVRNASDRSVLYTETDPLVPRFSKGRLWYARLKLAL
jgi:outer membrane receptor protein involved in Fe transport